MCSENKGADQLRSYCEADLRHYFRLCRDRWFSLVMAHYTPGIYADGYIAFAFPFVRSSVRMLVS